MLTREERESLGAWEKLAGTLEEAFHEPDLQAVRIMASAALSHTLWPDAPPVWLMLIGPSGSGKTSQIGPVVEAIEGCHTLSNLTDKTLLSGWAKGEDTGLLVRLGPSIIFWISDFSSITSMGPDARNAVAAQMREVYDGKISKVWGTGKSESWQGKCTMLIGATRQVEKAWSLMRDLGERFLYVRWRVGDLEELAVRSAMNDQRTRVREEITNCVRRWVSMARPAGERLEVSQIERTGLQKMASFVAGIRRNVDRDRNGNLVDVADSEAPGRIMNAFWLSANAHARLMGRVNLTEEDMDVARRIAADSIPSRRLMLLKAVARVCRERNLSAANSADIVAKLNDGGPAPMGRTTVDRELDTLSAVGGLIKSESSGSLWWNLSPWAEERMRLLCLLD